MTKEKLTKTIAQEILNGNLKNEKVKTMIDDLAVAIKEENDSFFSDDTIFRNGSFSLTVEKVENENKVILSTTYSNQKIDDNFIKLMNVLNDLKNELNKHIL